MKTVTIHQPEAFGGWLGLLDKISRADLFVILDHVDFEKNYFQNRQYIRTPQGKQLLNIPVERHNHKPIHQVRIDYSQKWQKKVIDSITQNYRKAPFFEKHFSLIEPLLTNEWESIADLNGSILAYMMEQFNVTDNVLFSANMDLDPALKGSDLILEICKIAEAECYLAGTSGRNYLDPLSFQEAGIKLTYHEFFQQVYQQVYPGFEPAMSSMDVLFRYGHMAKRVLNCKGGICLQEILKTIPDWQNKKILEMFGGSGEGHLRWYAPEAKDLSIWELDPANVKRLSDAYTHAKIEETNSLERLLTVGQTYDILIVDTPALMDVDELLPSIRSLLNDGGHLIYRAIKKSYNGHPDVKVTKQIAEIAEMLGNCDFKEYPREYYFNDQWLSNYHFKIRKN